MVGKLHSLWNAIARSELQSITKMSKDPMFFVKHYRLLLSFFLFLLFVSPSVMAQTLTEDFETGIPNEWGLFTSGEASINWASTTDGYNSNGAAFLDPSLDNIGEGNQGSYYLVSPNITLPENAQLHFMSKHVNLGDSNTIYKVMVSTAPQPDIDDFILLDSWTAADVEDLIDYTPRMIDLSLVGDGFDIYFAFVVENIQTGSEASGTPWLVDNVQVVSACINVDASDVEVSEITTNAANITWSHSDATYFDIQVVEAGESIDEDGGVNINGLSYYVSDLEPETEYDVYIRTICSGNIPSDWSLVTTFETMKYGMSCDEPIVIEGDSYYLEGNINEFPNTLLDPYPTHGTGCFASADDNYLGGNKIYFTYTPEEDGVINIGQMTLPFIPGTTCYGNDLSAVLIYENCESVGVECLAALRTTSTNRVETIDNFPVVAGNTYVIVMSTVFEGIDASVCFEFSFEFSKCPSPDEISFTDLLQDSVKFSWNNPTGAATSWEYVVLPASEDGPTGSGTTTSSNENVEITGLSPATDYRFYVRPVCDGEPGVWSDGHLFTTQCGVYDLPYYTGFIGADENNPEPCWTIIDVNGDGETWNYMAGWDIDNYATIWTETNQNYNHDYLVSPQIHIPTSDLTKKIRFKQQIVGWVDNAQSSYSIKASYTGIGEDNFTEVIVPETIVDNEIGWEEVTFDIPSHISGDVNFAWIVSPVGSGHTAVRLSITEVFIFEDCAEPSDLTVLDVTETSAQLSWTPASTDDSEWEVFVTPRGGTAPTTQTPGVIFDDSTIWYEDLDNGVRYDYYVRTSCSDTAKSDWVGPFEFYTLCSPIAEPYYETFDLNLDEYELNDPLTRRFCWTILDENNDGNTWSFTNISATIDLSENGNDDWLISPAIELTGDYHQVSFLHSGTESYDLDILISETDTDPDSFVELASLIDIDANSSYQTALEYFEASGTVHIALRVSPDSQSSNANITIDNFTVKVASSCPKPYDIERDAATNTFTWTSGDEETQWEVVLLTGDQTIPTSGVIVDEPSYTIEEDLDEGTEYKFFVRAICSTSNFSEWSGSYTFISECSQVFSMPFIETFEMDSESVNCWDPGSWLLNNALNPYEGQYSAIVYTWDGEPDRWLISPAIDVGNEDAVVSFYYKASQYAPSYTEDLKVWMSTTGNTQADFSTLLMEINDFDNTDYLQASIELPSNTTGQIYIAFEIPMEITNEYGFRQNVFIDNVEVKPLPDCPLPYNIEVTSIQDTQFQLSWDQVGEVSEWEALVVPYGTENPFDDIDPATIQTLTSNPGIVTGLEPATAYDVYLRPVCSDTNIGEWSELIQVVTVCSLENQCLYTITLHSGDYNTMGVSGGIDVMQNGYVVQTLEFPTADFVEIVQPIDYEVYLCDGVEYSLFWDSFGWAPDQYPEAYVQITDSNGDLVWDSGLGIGLPRTNIYTGLSICSDVSCAYPTDLSISELGELSWTPGGDETQWEVYIQPYELGALPTEGIIVDAPSYMPEVEDYINGRTGIYEYFVRAVCSDSDKSIWVGPFGFITNDESATAITAPVNNGEDCIQNLEGLSFLGSTVSEDLVSLVEIPHNSGDIWIEFEASSETHSIELGNFSGTALDQGAPELPRIIMVLYKDNDDVLEEIGWSDNNVLYTMYSAELEPGETYKVRLININEEIPNKYIFDLCITTIEPCTVNAPNYSFEKPGMVSSHTVETMYLDNVIPGWKDNSPVLEGTIFFWGTENEFYPAYHGGQFVQVPFQDEDDAIEPPAQGSSEIYGLYQDFDSSEITQFDYSFSHRRRPAPMFDVPGTRVIQLYAGPVGGPYELIKEEATEDDYWTSTFGKYDVPEDQDRTRFIFRTKNKFGMIVLDAANFIPFNGVMTADHSLDCFSPATSLNAEGYGEWSASSNNPAEVVMEEGEGNELIVSGFTAPGEYVFHWNTRYCQDSVTITYEGIEETPEVDSPVDYCQGEEATPLTASSLEGYELLFYTEATGGEGVPSITPNTSEVGTTTYYVAYVDEAGCEGERVAIDVIVYETIEPEVAFSYDSDLYCPSSISAIDYSDDFVFGGVFSASPSGLSIDPSTGSIDVASSTPGVYEVTYSVDADENICQLEGSYSVNVEILASVDFNITTYCDSGRFMLEAEFASEGISDEVSYTWQDESGVTLGTGRTLDFVNAMGGQVNLPSTINLVLEINGCEFTESIYLENALCEIPKGISPNGDGLNDNFDLSGMSVKHITIFNRYGTKVYSKSNYTNEWYGQSDKGKELPDGTYYYVIETSSGESITGWVYVNRSR